jgi:exosortase H (IPTLxxWG-CTERM-specific)
MHGDNGSTRMVVARFVAGMLALLVAFFFLLTQVPFVVDHLVNPFTSLVAKSTAAALTAIGIRFVAHGNSFFLGGFRTDIVRPCSGLEMMAILAAAVLAFPATARRKIVGIAAGLSGIYVVNVTRLVALILIGYRHGSILDQAHYVYGQALLLMATAGIWLLWVSPLSVHGRTRHH